MAVKNELRTRPEIVVAASVTPVVFAVRPEPKLCDGIADDVQIQAALDGLPSDGGVVRLSEGTFNLAAGITIPSNAALIGSGPKTTIMLWSDGNYHRVQNDDTAGGNSFIRIANLKMDFGGVAGSGDFHGIRFQNVTDLWMDNVELANSPHHNLLSFDDGDDVNARWYITNCYSHDAGQRTSTDGDGFRPSAGFAQGSPEDGAILIGCRSNDNSHHGFHLGSGCVAINCYADGNGTANGYLADHDSQIKGGFYTNPDGHNILCDGGQHGIIEGAYIDGSGGTGFDTILVDGTASTGLVISGNRIINSSRDGIRTETSEVIIKGNFIDGGSTGIVGVHVVDASRIIISDNLITDWDQSAARGIQLEVVSGSVARVLIRGNNIYSCGTGILIDNDAGVSNIWIDGNMLDGHTTTNLNDAGSKATIGSDFSGLTSKYSETDHTH